MGLLTIIHVYLQAIRDFLLDRESSQRSLGQHMVAMVNNIIAYTGIHKIQDHMDRKCASNLLVLYM